MNQVVDNLSDISTVTQNGVTFLFDQHERTARIHTTRRVKYSQCVVLRKFDVLVFRLMQNIS